MKNIALRRELEPFFVIQLDAFIIIRTQEADVDHYDFANFKHHHVHHDHHEEIFIISFEGH